MDELDPFHAPQPTSTISDARGRSRVVLRGLVLDVDPVEWVGGPVLEVTVSDGSGSLCLAFFGRHRIGGLEPGRVVTVAGTLGTQAGRPTLLNPCYWLYAPLVEVRDA